MCDLMWPHIVMVSGFHAYYMYISYTYYGDVSIYYIYATDLVPAVLVYLLSLLVYAKYYSCKWDRAWKIYTINSLSVEAIWDKTWSRCLSVRLAHWTTINISWQQVKWHQTNGRMYQTLFSLLCTFSTDIRLQHKLLLWDIFMLSQLYLLLLPGRWKGEANPVRFSAAD